MSSIQKIERPKQINEVVLERLREDIVNGVFEMGEKISEQQLSERYGVTKAPVRAAYVRLRSEGLVDIRPQAGTFVFRPSPDGLRSLCELRIALELEAARLSIRRAQGELFAQLSAIFNRMKAALESGKHERYQRLDADLHLTFFELAQSPYLLETYKARVFSAFAALRHRFAQASSHNEASNREHEEILNLIGADDPRGLQIALRRHIEHTEAYYEDFLAQT